MKVTSQPSTHLYNYSTRSHRHSGCDNMYEGTSDSNPSQTTHAGLSNFELKNISEILDLSTCSLVIPHVGAL